jgi:hypothetical protein
VVVLIVAKVDCCPVSAAREEVVVEVSASRSVRRFEIRGLFASIRLLSACTLVWMAAIRESCSASPASTVSSVVQFAPDLRNWTSAPTDKASTSRPEQKRRRSKDIDEGQKESWDRSKIRGGKESAFL